MIDGQLTGLDNQTGCFVGANERDLELHLPDYTGEK